MREKGVVCGQASDSRRHVTLLSSGPGRTPVLRTIVGPAAPARHRITRAPLAERAGLRKSPARSASNDPAGEGQPRSRTDRQVTQPSSFSSSEMSTATTRSPRASKDARVSGAALDMSTVCSSRQTTWQPGSSGTGS